MRVSSRLGGKPVKSSAILRSQVAGAARGEGFRPSASSRASTNESKGWRSHSGSETSGSAGRAGGSNAQCVWYSAPSEIQWRSTSTSEGSKGSCPKYAGGMRVAGLVDDTRKRSSLLSGLPGLMGVRPEAVGTVAASRLSRRKPAWRCAASGPWQLKQRSASSGLTCRPKSMVAAESVDRTAAQRYKQIRTGIRFGLASISPATPFTGIPVLWRIKCFPASIFISDRSGFWNPVRHQSRRRTGKEGVGTVPQTLRLPTPAVRNAEGSAHRQDARGGFPCDELSCTARCGG